jgi:AcrR family transcriptional regulator
VFAILVAMSDGTRAATPVNGGRDRRAERHRATRDEIIAAAWAQVRERGLAGLSLRDVARAVGMRPPSVYSYFDSKASIYDAMYAEGNAAFTELLVSLPRHDDPRATLRQSAKAVMRFAMADPARTQLLFQRTVPDFEPSPASYAMAVRALDDTRDLLRSVGAGRDSDVDVWTALLSGLITQQLSNDPEGTRWIDRCDDAVDMFLAWIDSR